MIYLASPYTHKSKTVMERRFEQVAEVTARLINRGHVIYSPILHFHPLAVRHSLPRDFAFWEEVNKNILLRADALWVLTLSGWKESRGVQSELQIAERAGIGYKLVKPETWLS